MLAGDSVFDNKAYVARRQSVPELLQRQLSPENVVSLLAVDGDVAADVAKQLASVPSGATHVLLSVGGNDALGCLALMEEKCSTVFEAVNKLWVAQNLFSDDYQKATGQLTQLGLPCAICTIYDGVPNLPEGLKTALSLFNDVIVREALKYGFKVLDLRELFSQDEDFSEVSPIEPSATGGAKLAIAIGEWVNSTSLERKVGSLEPTIRNAENTRGDTV